MAEKKGTVLTSSPRRELVIFLLMATFTLDPRGRWRDAKLTPCGSELRCAISAVAILFFEGAESTASSRTFCEEREELIAEWTHLWKPRYTGRTVEVGSDKQAGVPVQPNISARAVDLNFAWQSSADTMCRMCVLRIQSRLRHDVVFLIFQSLPRASP